MRPVAYLFLGVVCALFVSANANSQALQFTDEAGSASREELAEAVGEIRWHYSCPQNRTQSLGAGNGLYVQRTMRMWLTKPGLAYRDPRVLGGLLRVARTRLMERCPIYTVTMMDRTDLGIVGWVEIVGRPTGTEEEALVRTRGYFTGLANHGWNDVTDVYAEAEATRLAQAAEQQRMADEAAREAAEAAERQAAEQALAAQREAEAQARAVRAAEMQQARAVREENNRRWRAEMWGHIQLFGVMLFLVWLWFKRETIARWYYGLQPHPAADIVERALYTGGDIDGDLYERILRPVPGDPIERGVRARQADELAERLRRHEAALRAEEASRVEAARREVERENAFTRAHAELLKAGVDHELAAARVKEMREGTRK